MGGYLLVLSIGLLFNACQKDDVNTAAETDTAIELTAKQVELKNKMNEAARIIATFSDDKDVQQEVAKMIDMQMYGDDYVRFKDLFRPEENSKLKSAAATHFAKRFRHAASSSLLKSGEASDFDLEKFLVENDLVLYVPYPLEDYPEGNRIPTISFHPLTNDSVNIGYVFSNLKSSNQVQQVPEVNEAYAGTHPVYIITPEGEIVDGDIGFGSGDLDNFKSSVSTGSHIVFKMRELRVTDCFGGIFSGGPDIHIVFADAVVIDAENNTSEINTHAKTTIHFSRSQVRKMAKYGKKKKYKTWGHDVNLTLDPDWKPEELTNYIGMVELDRNGTVTLGLKASIKVSDKVTLTPSFSYTVKSTNDLIGERELPRDFVIASEKNHNLESGTHNGRVIRKMNNAVEFTTEIIYYN